MRRYTDPVVSCPYEPEKHTMKKPRLVWHLEKCKSRADHLKAGKPEFHCKNNYLHILFDKESLVKHEETCDDIGKRESHDEEVQEWLQVSEGPEPSTVWS